MLSAQLGPPRSLCRCCCRLQLSARNTSLGAACNPGGGCGAPSHSGLMIALSVLLGSLALCLLQRHICWRCRVAALLAEAEVSGSLCM